MTTKDVKETRIRRRHLLKALAAVGISGPAALNLLAQSKTKISVPIVRNASAILGENFTEERLQVIETALQRNLDQFQIVRDFEVDDLIEPAPMFVTKRYSAGATAHHASVTHETGDPLSEVGDA
jgi:hypothetical protein